MNKPKVSIVMTSLNGKRWVEGFFNSVLKTNYPNYEIIFVDGGSTDGSLEYVQKKYHSDKRVKIYIAKGTGWSGGNNYGVTKASGDYLALISNDIEVDPGWLTELVLTFGKDDKIGVIQCNVHRIDDRSKIDSGINYLDRFGYSYGYQPNDQDTEVFFAEGMAFAFKKEVVNTIGLMDEYYFMEYDDMDYSWRARLAGFKVVWSSKAIVYHAGGGTAGASYFERRPRNVTQYSRNHLISILKNNEFKNLPLNFVVSLAIEIAKALFFLLSRNYIFAKAAFKGIIEVFTHLPYIIKERSIVQRMRVRTDNEIMQTMVPFSPRLLFGFLSKEKKKERFMIQSEPQVYGGVKYVE